MGPWVNLNVETGAASSVMWHTSHTSATFLRKVNILGNYMGATNGVLQKLQNRGKNCVMTLIITAKKLHSTELEKDSAERCSSLTH